MRRTDRNPRCPVNVALEAVGDPWSLIVVRDVVFHGKRTFGEFLASDERITTSVLADRLSTLVGNGVLTRHRCPEDRRVERYGLSGKGLDLIPVLVELANWGLIHGPEVIADPLWVHEAQPDRSGLCNRIRTTVEAGGAVFRGPGSVIEQLAQLHQA